MLVGLGLLILAVGALGLVAVAGTLVWSRPGLLSGFGALLVLSQLYRIAWGLILFPWALRPALEWLAAGVALWLAGHWLYAARWRRWRSGLAAWVFGLPVLRALTP